MIGLGARYRHQVVINTRDDKTFRGIYWGAPGKVIKLREASMMTPNGPLKIDGEVVVMQSNISFVQRLHPIE